MIDGILILDNRTIGNITRYFILLWNIKIKNTAIFNKIHNVYVLEPDAIAVYTDIIAVILYKTFLLKVFRFLNNKQKKQMQY